MNSIFFSKKKELSFIQMSRNRERENYNWKLKLEFLKLLKLLLFKIFCNNFSTLTIKIEIVLEFLKHN